MTNISQQIIDVFTKDIPPLYNNESPRQQQVQMALDVADFLFNSDKKIMFVEAPVGTGKSLGLLVPASIYANEMDKRMIYATATINLQNQIEEEDSKVLCDIDLIKREQIILAQGMNNYLCSSLIKPNRKQFNIDELKDLNAFFDTAEIGLKSEFEVMFPDFDRKKLKFLKLGESEDRDCNCVSHHHRKLYQSPQKKLVITNHNQLIKSYDNAYNNRNRIVDFDCGVLIIDEAHALKANFLSIIEDSFNFKKLPNIDDDFFENHSDLKIEYRDILLELRGFRITINNDTKRSKSESIKRLLKESEIDLFIRLKSILDKILEALLFTPYFNRDTKYRTLQGNLEHLSESIKTLTNSDTKKWFDFDINDYMSIHSTTVLFKNKFFEMVKKLSRVSKIIFMSGTLTTVNSEKTDEQLTADWGVSNNQFIYKSFPSVFSLRNQALIYIPEGLKSPKNLMHLESVYKKLPNLLNLFEGGSLVLCTSNDYVSSISTFLKKNTEILEKVFSQNDGSVSLISKKFKADINSVLVGSGSYFTGFSVQGHALNKLFLTKLPYPIPNDPFVELVSEGMNDTERQEKVVNPLMLTTLEQILGRLIRSTSDYGFITIFDNRIIQDNKKVFIRDFIEKIGYQITSNQSDIEKFIYNHTKNSIEPSNVTFNTETLSVPTIETSKKTPSLFKQQYNLQKDGYTTVSNEDLKKWLKTFVRINGKGQKRDFRMIYQHKSAHDFYQEGVNFCYRMGLPIELVSSDFKFQSEEQKMNFEKIKPSVSGSVLKEN